MTAGLSAAWYLVGSRTRDTTLAAHPTPFRTYFDSVFKHDTGSTSTGAFMRLSLLLLITFGAVMMGCVTEGDKIYNSYNYFHPDTTGNDDTTATYSIDITGPARNEVLEIWHDWVENPYSNYGDCNWGYRVDTMFYAEVATNIPETIIEARVFLRTSAWGSFYEHSSITNPGNDLFVVRIFNYSTQFQYNVPGDMDCAFWVNLTTADSANYISPTVPFRVVSRVHYDLETIPATPVADTLFESTYQQRLTISWCRESPDIDSFHVDIRRDATAEIRRLSFSGSEYYGTNFTDYLPVTDYSVWVSALNEYGESAPSDTMQVTTNEPVPPEEFRASTYSDSRVELWWYNRSHPDSLLIARRDTLGDWTTIGTLVCEGGYCPTAYSVTTAVRNAIYYYRLGMRFENGLWWAPDSVGVWLS
ncbi:MAG: fibronectin type III domain-containing protein [bacterium]|nr:fibronectin type III domain-containing protein [bacterium]